MAPYSQISCLSNLPVELQQQIYHSLISEWSLAMIKPNDYPDLDSTFTVKRTTENALSVIPGTNLVQTCRTIYHIVRELQRRTFTGRLVCNLEAPAARSLLQYGPESDGQMHFSLWFRRVRSIHCIGTVLCLTTSFFEPFTALKHFELQLSEQSKSVWDKYAGCDKSLRYPGDETLALESQFWADIVLSKSGRMTVRNKAESSQSLDTSKDDFVVDIKMLRYYEHTSNGNYDKLVTGIAAGYLIRRSLSSVSNTMSVTVTTRAIGRWSIFFLDYEKDTTDDLTPEFQIATDDKWTWKTSSPELRWVMSPTARKLKDARCAINEEIASLKEASATLDPKWRDFSDWYVESRRNTVEASCGV